MPDKNPNHDLGQTSTPVNLDSDKKTREPDEMNSHGQTNGKPTVNSSEPKKTPQGTPP